MGAIVCPAIKRFNGPPYLWTLIQKSFQIMYRYIWVMCKYIFQADFRLKMVTNKEKNWATQLVLQQKDLLVLLIYVLWAKNHIKVSMNTYMWVICASVFSNDVLLKMQKLGATAYPATKIFNGILIH